MTSIIKAQQAGIASLCEKHGVRHLDVFGSAANDTFVEGSSDLDFVVEFKPAPVEGAFDRYFDLLFDLQNLSGCKVDLLTEKSITNPYLKESIEASRIRIYESPREKLYRDMIFRL